jgi:hypothetical protein
LKILQISLGNVRGIGMDTQHKIEYIERTGYARAAMFVNTLDAIVKVLEGWPDDTGIPQKQVPKCIFVVHGVQADVQELCDKLASEYASLIGNRKLMCLPDVDDSAKATKFNREFRPFFKNQDGWIFISHRGVNRGVDIAGCEAATMVVNYRYASIYELTQTLGRANRSLSQENAPAYVFHDIDEIRLKQPIGQLQANEDVTTRQQGAQSDAFLGQLNMLMIREKASDKIKAMKIRGQPNQEFHRVANRLAEAMGMYDDAIYMWILVKLLEKQIAIESELKLMPKVKNGST